MIKVGIVGVSGYGGIELFRILKNHPEVKINAVSTQTYEGKQLSEIYPHLTGSNIICKNYSPDQLTEICDVVFTSVPHGGPAMDYALPIKRAGIKLIDLSADFRLKDKAVYEKWYETDHKVPELLNEAVYGLPELYKTSIRKTWLVANPGCYTTAAILSSVPLLKEKLIDEKSIIIDAKSGTSGAGRKIKQMFHFSELNEGFQAYNITKHRHTPEIEQELSSAAHHQIVINFTPNLVPMTRGILSVTYANLLKSNNEKYIIDAFKSFYKDQPFVRILEDVLPNTKYVTASNYIDISVKVDPRTNRVIVVSAIDNLMKGASGQAVQNMNIMFGLDETLGLNFLPLYP